MYSIICAHHMTNNNTKELTILLWEWSDIWLYCLVGVHPIHWTYHFHRNITTTLTYHSTELRPWHISSYRQACIFNSAPSGVIQINKSDKTPANPFGYLSASNNIILHFRADLQCYIAAFGCFFLHIYDRYRYITQYLPPSLWYGI